MSEANRSHFLKSVGEVLVVLVVLGCIAVGAWHMFFVMIPTARTETLVRNEAKHIVRTVAGGDDPMEVAEKDGTWVEGKKTDYWGKALRYSCSARKESITCFVESAGKDGEFNTSDDITGVHADYNKSYLVGRWAGEKSKEVVSGVAEGLRRKSPFLRK